MVEVHDPYVAQAKFFKWLAHPVRLQILEILAEEECCVCHLTTILKQRQPYVSQQLMTLRNAKLVTGRRDGVVVYYHLAVPSVKDSLRLARQTLSETHGEMPVIPVPRSPVPGCPCPKCDNSGCGS